MRGLVVLWDGGGGGGGGGLYLGMYLGIRQ